MNGIASEWSWVQAIATAKSTQTRLQETLLTTLLGNLPTVAFGNHLRKLLYPQIFPHFGKAVCIETDVKFYGAAGIEIGDRVKISSGVRLNTLGAKHNRISLASGVTLERGVDLGTLQNSAIEIGESTYIGLYTCITGYGNIKIGKNCLIAAHCGIYGNEHIFADRSQTIADQGVTVIDGVTIGQGSVIGAGSVVNRNILPYSVAVGVPARVISQRQVI